MSFDNTYSWVYLCQCNPARCDFIKSLNVIQPGCLKDGDYFLQINTEKFTLALIIKLCFQNFFPREYAK